MAEDSDLEKTEQPSQRRLDQAREKGQVARSRELSTFTVLMAGGGTLWFMDSTFTQHLVKLLHDGLTLDQESFKKCDASLCRSLEAMLSSVRQPSLA